MANIDLGNLTRYDGKIKEYAEDKYLSKNTANWQMTEKAGAVTCYPVPDTELEPIVDFSFKEVPPASGDKSPSNPSTIEGVNSINLTRANSNLIKWPYYDSTGKNSNGVTWTVNADGSVSATGTSTDGTVFQLQATSGILTNGMLLAPGVYYLSGCPNGGSWGQTWALRVAPAPLEIANITTNADFGNGAIITVTKPVHASFFCGIWENNTVTNLTFKPKLQLVSLPYEKNEQNIYTYSLGNTYYGGKVNLATGLMTVTQQSFIFDGSENWSESSGRFLFNLSPVNNAIWNAYSLQTCTHYLLDASGIAEDSFWLSRYYIYIKTSGTLEEFKNFLATQYANSTPVVVTYALFSPYTVQLTPIQIKSLFALDKNIPRLNTLYTDADSIQVGYQKHPARTAYELENAILALGGGE